MNRQPISFCIITYIIYCFKIHIITGSGVISYVPIAYSKMIKICIVLIFTSDALFISAGFGKLLWPVTFVISDRISKRIWVGLHSPTLCHTLLYYSTLSTLVLNTLLHYATVSYTTPHSPTPLQTLLLYATLSYTRPHSPTLPTLSYTTHTLLHYSKLSYTTLHCPTMCHTPTLR